MRLLLTVALAATLCTALGAKPAIQRGSQLTIEPWGVAIVVEK